MRCPAPGCLIVLALCAGCPASVYEDQLPGDAAVAQPRPRLSVEEQCSCDEDFGQWEYTVVQSVAEHTLHKLVKPDDKLLQEVLRREFLDMYQASVGAESSTYRIPNVLVRREPPAPGREYWAVVYEFDAGDFSGHVFDLRMPILYESIDTPVTRQLRVYSALVGDACLSSTTSREALALLDKVFLRELVCFEFATDKEHRPTLPVVSFAIARASGGMDVICHADGKRYTYYYGDNLMEMDLRRGP